MTTAAPTPLALMWRRALTLDGGTQIGGLGGGTLTIETGGEITVTGSGATLDGVTVSDRQHRRRH